MTPIKSPTQYYIHIILESCLRETFDSISWFRRRAMFRAYFFLVFVWSYGTVSLSEFDVS
jgi:hypothetical protein